MSTFFCYQDNPVRASNKFNMKYDQMPATSYWLTHFSNSLYLTFLVQTEPGLIERNRAAYELGIAERKMAYWKKHPNWDMREATRKAEELKKQWSGKRYAE